MIQFTRSLLAMGLATTMWLAGSTTPGMAQRAPAGTPAVKPNIVFIFADDLGYGDIGAFGASDVKTPNIDALAEMGAKFTQFYSASPICSPSRAGLLTGRYPIRMGINEVFLANSYTGLPEAEVTMAEMLRDAGYATAAIGKWHLGHHQQHLPLNHGFDEFYGIPYSNDITPLPMMRGNDVVERTIDQTQLTKRLTDEAVRFIDRHKEQPFFLYLAHPMPHVPLYTSKAFEDVSDRGLYGDVIAELDASVGDVVDALARNGQLENTLVVFSSDNGPWIFMGEDGGSPGPLRNGKGTTFEGGVRVPTLAAFPNTIAPGSTYDAPASMLDWFPTFADIADAELPDDRALDGINIAPRLRDGTTNAERPRAFAHYSHGKLEAIRVGNWKLKRPYDASSIPLPAPLKLFLGGEVGLRSHQTMLFDLAADPGERTNLASANPEKVAEMEAEMVRFEAQLGDVPENITEFDLSIPPAQQVVFAAIAKLVLCATAVLLICVAIAAFFLGRRAGRKTS